MMDVRKFTTMDFDTPSMKAFDWGLAAVSIAYGAWSGSTLWIVAGLLGAAAAWFRPLSRMQRFLNGLVKARR